MQVRGEQGRKAGAESNGACGLRSHGTPRQRSGGFTMAELLAVVAIVAILGAIVGIAIFNYLRGLTVDEYDGAAKSLYIAAQNNISELQASGEWGLNEGGVYTPFANTPTADRTDDDGRTQNDGLQYYYIDAATARSNGILPFGSIDEDVRSRSFVIEYCYQTATVYGVFYTEGTQTQMDAYYKGGMGGGASIRERDARRANNPIVGYYGGAAASELSHVSLAAPVVSAGRSPVLAVTDGNLAAHKADWKTITLVTLTKAPDEEGAAAPSVTLMLSTGINPLVPQVGYVNAAGVAETVADNTFCMFSDTDSNTYSINLTALKAHPDIAGLMEGFQAGDEYQVSARCTTAQRLCLPQYGYGTGVWPSSDDVVFTANIIADYETSADVHLYRSETEPEAASESVSFNLENFYNSATFANEDLYYQFDVDSGIEVESVRDSEDPERDIVPTAGYYLYASDSKPHTVTFHVNDPDGVSETAPLALRVNVFRKNAHTGIISTEIGKTLTINVYVLNTQRGYTYAVEDHGATVDVVIQAGAFDAPAIVITSNMAAVAEPENRAVAHRAEDGKSVMLNTVPATGSVSVKFIKTTAAAPVHSGSFLLQPGPTG